MGEVLIKQPSMDGVHQLELSTLQFSFKKMSITPLLPSCLSPGMESLW